MIINPQSVDVENLLVIVLVKISIVGKRGHDCGNSDKGKHLIDAIL